MESTVDEVGRVATRLPAPVRTEEDLIAVLRLGRHRVEHLQPSTAGQLSAG